MTANDASSSVPAVGGDKEQQQEAASLAFPVQQCYRSIAHVEHGFMLGRRRYQCPGKESNDAPSPPVPPAATDETPLAFTGHDPRRCGEHRTVGSHRAWCHDCGEWCYPQSPCPGCEPLVGVCVICSSNVYHDGGHFPEASPVPAATDDEAALAVIAGLDSVHDDKCEAEFIEGAFAYTGCDCPRRLVAALHAQGYRIVKDQR